MLRCWTIGCFPPPYFPLFCLPHFAFCILALPHTHTHIDSHNTKQPNEQSQLHSDKALVLCTHSWLPTHVSRHAHRFILTPASWLSSEIKAAFLLSGMIGLHGNIQFVISTILKKHVRELNHPDSLHGFSVESAKYAETFLPPTLWPLLLSFLSVFPLKCHSGPPKISCKRSQILTPSGTALFTKLWQVYFLFICLLPYIGS